jgi:hypothetical protein
MLMDGGGRTLDINPALDSAGTRFIDVNGDGRADWIYIHDNTTLEIRINQRGDRSDGKGLKPHWRNPSSQLENWPSNDKVTRDHILFGRILALVAMILSSWSRSATPSTMCSISTATRAMVVPSFEAMECDTVICTAVAMMSEYAKKQSQSEFDVNQLPVGLERWQD